MKKAIILALASLSTAASAQQPVSEIKATEVVPGMHMLEGADGFAGGNMTLLSGDDQVVLIDDGLGAVAGMLYEKASEVAGRGIDFVINTHVHGDHVGSNAHFADNGAVVLAHDNIRKRLLDSPGDAGGEAGLPVLTFSDSVTFHVNGNEAYVFHLQHAHTDGDAAILFRNVNVLVTGDVQFRGLFPFIDLDNGGDVDGYIAAQKKMLSMIDDDTRIVPGHGPINDKAGLETDLEVLIDSRKRVKELLDAGRNEEQILAANPLSVYHDEYNWGFITTERMTRTLIRSLNED
ncbi:MAG: MBL fold metallo-hydrolase [Pseudomonadota bacterium]